MLRYRREPLRSATVASTRVLDFLDVTAPGGCRCPPDQRAQECRVDLGELAPPPPAPLVRHKKEKILRPFRDWRDRVILDVGCREGPIGHGLARSNHVAGVDACPQKSLVDSPNVLDKGYAELLLADARDLPLEDAQADLVLANDLLEHLVTPEDALREFRRVLKKGGQLLVTVPNLVSYNNRLSVLFGSGSGYELHRLLKGKSPRSPITGPRYPDQRQHLRFFTRKSLKRTLLACGFQIVRTWGFDPVLSRLPGGDRMLANLCQLAVALARKSEESLQPSAISPQQDDCR